MNFAKKLMQICLKYLPLLRQKLSKICHKFSNNCDINKCNFLQKVALFTTYRKQSLFTFLWKMWYIIHFFVRICGFYATLSFFLGTS